MTQDNVTTIEISKETSLKLIQLAKTGETNEDIIKRLIKWHWLYEDLWDAVNGIETHMQSNKAQ